MEFNNPQHKTFLWHLIAHCVLRIVSGRGIMYPTIFSLALRDAGTKTKLASSLLIMTIVGGAVAPVIFRKPTRPSLPLRKAPPLTPALSPQELGRKPPYSVLGTASL